MILGVTGGIACGKSTVAALFEKLGAQVISADAIARELVTPGSAVLAQLVARFGRTIVAADATLDRQRLAALVFGDDTARQALDAIMHPAIAILSSQKLQQAVLRQPGQLVVYEAPLLYEAGAEGRVDKVLAVTIDPELQVQRLQQRDQCSPDAARQRIAAQWPQAEKARRADYVIDNSHGLDALHQQVAALYQQLMAASQR